MGGNGPLHKESAINIFLDVVGNAGKGVDTSFCMSGYGILDAGII